MSEKTRSQIRQVASQPNRWRYRHPLILIAIITTLITIYSSPSQMLNENEIYKRHWINRRGWTGHRSEYFVCRKTPSPFAPPPQQRAPRKSPRPQPPPTPGNDISSSSSAPSIHPQVTTEALLAACKVQPSNSSKPTFTFEQKNIEMMMIDFHGNLQGKKWSTSTSSSHKTSLFERLSDDLLLRVFSLLTSSEVAVCGRVCRRWHVLAWQPQLWSTIVLTGDNLSVDRALKVSQSHQSQTTPSPLPPLPRTQFRHIT